jgi:hypothetical protein
MPMPGTLGPIDRVGNDQQVHFPEIGGRCEVDVPAVAFAETLPQRGRRIASAAKRILARRPHCEPSSENRSGSIVRRAA